ncbi:MAG: hypothetical protein ACI88G_001009 [Woeseiaceae bacterium]|jgi:hypothetical protein
MRINKKKGMTMRYYVSIAGRVVLSIICLFAIVACTPAPQDNDTSSVAETSPEPLQPYYRSAKTISSSCDVEYWAGGPPGFAEMEGVPLKDMPPPMATNMEVGAGREMIPTDAARVAPGYTLVEPGKSKTSLLIDNDHEVVATFTYDYSPGLTEILPNGNRFVIFNSWGGRFKPGGGFLGCMEEYSVDGQLLWRIGMAFDNYINHHDVARMANGNILALVWENESVDHAISQGRDPDVVAEDGDFWYDGVIEVNPYTAEIVWEWSTRNHLIQEFDESKANFGVVAEHPELLNINLYDETEEPEDIGADWIHTNSIDYNEELDQILISSNYLSEVWVIDHSTSAFEAAGHTGGRHGKGGDFIYRWGNPANYNRGTEEDRQIFHQHDVQWIKAGLFGAGNILLFNNGNSKLRPYSTVVEFTPAMNADGTYSLESGSAYGPQAVQWEYDPQPPERFFSFFISGAQRLPNGNTLVNQGAGAKIREVTPDGEIVWEFRQTDYGEVPDMLFRANKYPPDHPGIAKILATGN